VAGIGFRADDEAEGAAAVTNESASGLSAALLGGVETVSWCAEWRILERDGINPIATEVA
jgi:hypothetical protein